MKVNKPLLYTAICSSNERFFNRAFSRFGKSFHTLACTSTNWISVWFGNYKHNHPKCLNKYPGHYTAIIARERNHIPRHTVCVVQHKLVCLIPQPIVLNGIYSSIPYVFLSLSTLLSGPLADYIRSHWLSTGVTRKLMDIVGESVIKIINIPWFF